MTFRDLLEKPDSKRIPGLDFGLSAKDANSVKKAFSKEFKSVKDLDKAVVKFFISKINTFSKKEGGGLQDIKNVKDTNITSWKKEIIYVIESMLDEDDFKSFLGLVK